VQPTRSSPRPPPSSRARRCRHRLASWIRARSLAPCRMVVQWLHTIFYDIFHPRHLEKCQTHFWIKVSETLLDVLRHLISSETFHSKYHTFTHKV
jgi:hypothetical protein